MEETSPPGPLSDAARGRKKERRVSSGVVVLQYVDEHKKEQARRLRRESTPAEKTLWQRLRNRQVEGLKFRRQQVIDGFLADFYCEQIKLVIELDGAVHEQPSQEAMDEHRRRVFAMRGIATLRFTNDAIFKNIEECVGVIVTTADKRR